MLSFRPLTLADLPEIRPYFAYSPSRQCDATSAAVMWRGFFTSEFAVGNDALFIRSQHNGFGEAYMMPLGGDFFAGIETVLALCRLRSKPALFSVVSRDELDKLRMRYNVVRAETMRDWSDYLYESGDMINLAGRRFHGQRNHISRFDREYPVHRWEPLTADTSRAVEFLDRFYAKNPPADTFGHAERDIVYEVITHFDIYGQLSGALSVGGDIVSLSIGEIVGDTLFVHIEKADTAYHGVYQKTVSLFARTYGQNVRYINREEDMGSPGLRKSKLSYHPVALLEKYMVEIEL